MQCLHDQVVEGGFRGVTSALAGIPTGRKCTSQGDTSAGWEVEGTSWEGRAQEPGEGAGRGLCIVATAAKTSFLFEKNL